MEENDEIKKDKEDFTKFLKAFCEKENLSYPMVKKSIDMESNFKCDPIKNHFGLRTPARINKSGIIEVDKKHFMPEKGTLEYHRLKINMFTRMTIFEAQNIEGNIQHKVNITNERIREWYDYTEYELKQYNESIEFLKELNLGKEIKKDYLAIGIVAKLKYDLIRKFWWRMGLFGIKQRIKLLLRKNIIKK